MTMLDQPRDVGAASMPIEGTDLRVREPRVFTTFLVGRLVGATGIEDLCRIRNISALGMLIETRQPLAIGECIAIELRTGECLTGTVVHKRPGRFGVELNARIDVEHILHSHIARPTRRNATRVRAPRFAADCTARMTGMGHSCTAIVQNLSQSGVRLTLARPFTLAGPLTLRIPGLGVRECAMRWNEGEEVGLAFLDMIPFVELSAWLSQGRDDGAVTP